MYKPLNPKESVLTGEINWEFVSNLQEKLNMLYSSEAVSEMGERHSYLNLTELKYRKNPEIVATI